MAKSCLGLDIGSYQIKIAELVRQGKHRYRINNLCRFFPPKGSMAQDRLVDPKALAFVLREVLDKHEIRTDRVVLGLNSHNMSIRQVSMPRMSSRELEQAVELDLAEILKLPTSQAVESIYYSYDVFSRGHELDVVVVGCSKEILDPHIAMIKAAELTAMVIDVAAFNLPRIVDNSSQTRTCYVDLGYGQTVLYVESHGFYSVYRIIPVGGRMLDEAAAAAFEMDVFEAQKLKYEYSLEEMLRKGTGDKSMLRSVIHQYTGGIMQTLDYLRSQSRASRVSDILDQVVLCGGISHVHGLVTAFQQELDITVKRLNPFETYSLAKGIDQPVDYGVYANSIGLAMRGLSE